ncbi:MAG TPA: universal stress protein [Gaiellaceae bacterium]|nr:universal stress protein [Gaiellaceae bacterium]
MRTTATSGRVEPGSEEHAAGSVFRRAVVGVDGTERGFEALRQTLVLAPAGSRISAITALDTGPAMRTGFQSEYWVDQLRQEAAAAREAAEAILAGRPGCEARVVAGKPVDVLRRESGELDATLLALGGQHSSRLLGIMLGDTSTELLHDGVRSVLVARPRTSGTWQPRAVVVGVDGSAPSLAALETADDLAARLGAEVEVVHATGPGSARPDGDWAAGVTEWDEAGPVAALLDRSRAADLVLVGSRGVHGIRAIGSVSERVAHRARCSVLVVHPVDAPLPRA